MIRLHTETCVVFYFFIIASLRKENVMAAGSIFEKIICIIGIAAALAVLLITLTGAAVICYGIRHFDEWEEKW